MMFYHDYRKVVSAVNQLQKKQKKGVTSLFINSSGAPFLTYHNFIDICVGQHLGKGSRVTPRKSYNFPYYLCLNYQSNNFHSVQSSISNLISQHRLFMPDTKMISHLDSFQRYREFYQYEVHVGV